MSVTVGFDNLASVPEERITGKIARRVISGKQGTLVYWRTNADAHVAAHQHPQEQFVWVIKGSIRFRIGAEERTIQPGYVAVIPGGVEHEAFFPEDTEVIELLRSGARGLSDRRGPILHGAALSATAVH